jgi:phosphoribosylformimino-5-aminoimidazole carboxamide ribotide isomerase
VSPITLYPAIDILDGKAVRLTRGSFDQSKIYESDPRAAARRWVDEGAEALHVVDLDGARCGHPVSLEHLARIAELGPPVQYGGGLRSLEHISDALEAGADRVVLGTAAFADPELLDTALQKFGERISVAVDVRQGRVATRGWVESLELSGEDAVQALGARGVRRIVYTNVDRDGTLDGVDPGDVSRAATAAAGGLLVYSGGVGSIDDLIAIAAVEADSLDGVIVGKALYEERFRLPDAKRALATPEGAREWS